MALLAFFLLYCFIYLLIYFLFFEGILSLTVNEKRTESDVVFFFFVCFLFDLLARVFLFSCVCLA